MISLIQVIHRKRKPPIFPEKIKKNWGFQTEKIGIYKPNLPAKIFGFLIPAGLLTKESSYSPAFPTRVAGAVASLGFRPPLQLRGSGGFSPRFPFTSIKNFRRLFHCKHIFIIQKIAQLCQRHYQRINIDLQCRKINRQIEVAGSRDRGRSSGQFCFLPSTLLLPPVPIFSPWCLRISPCRTIPA